jgi:hypothetical protein
VSSSSPGGRLALRLIVLVTAGSLLPLVAWDVAPGSFSPHAHDLVAAAPLAAVAVVCVLQAVVRGVPRGELAKSIALAAAFLSWAANQLWPDLPQATLFNDIAVALFVIDVIIPFLGRGAEPKIE